MTRLLEAPPGAPDRDGKDLASSGYPQLRALEDRGRFQAELSRPGE